MTEGGGVGWVGGGGGCGVFFCNDTATTEIYTLSLHDALPIFLVVGDGLAELPPGTDVEEVHLFVPGAHPVDRQPEGDRKSTRLNSSYANISYAVFCLKKQTPPPQPPLQPTLPPPAPVYHPPPR